MCPTPSADDLYVASILINLLGDPSRSTFSPSPKDIPPITSLSTIASDLPTDSPSSVSSSSDSTSACSSRCQSVDTDEPVFEGQRRVTRVRARSTAIHPYDEIDKVSRAKAPRARKSRTNLTTPERIEEFHKQRLLGELRPRAAWCLECEGWVGLDKRRSYYLGMWEKHIKAYHLPGGKQYELMEKHLAQTGKKLKLFKPRRRGDEWMFE